MVPPALEAVCCAVFNAELTCGPPGMLAKIPAPPGPPGPPGGGGPAGAAPPPKPNIHPTALEIQTVTSRKVKS